MKHTLSCIAATIYSVLASPPVMANDRPPIYHVPASSLLPKCRIAVQFNEDEASVKEADYVDGSYCMGLVRGVLGFNEHFGPTARHFCLPPQGLKAWESAKVVVEYAKAHPELQDLREVEFVIRAFKDTFPCRLPQLSPTG